jgi:hypothetical protein
MYAYIYAGYDFSFDLKLSSLGYLSVDWRK